jgi:hypothetical protein
MKINRPTFGLLFNIFQFTQLNKIVSILTADFKDFSVAHDIEGKFQVQFYVMLK